LTSERWDSPEDAERAFYLAFEAGDLEAMMAVWDETADVCCIHPMGQALCGPDAVREGWREILASGQRLQFSAEPALRQIGTELAVSVVREHIRVVGQDKTSPPMVATNVYRRTTGGWRMTLHHVSPAVVAMGNGMEDKPASRYLH
jgi:ketosteroid isomerase-like protein